MQNNNDKNIPVDDRGWPERPAFRDAGTFLAKVDALREQANLPPLTDEIFREAKSDGRP